MTERNLILSDWLKDESPEITSHFFSKGPINIWISSQLITVHRTQEETRKKINQFYVCTYLDIFLNESKPCHHVRYFLLSVDSFSGLSWCPAYSFRQPFLFLHHLLLEFHTWVTRNITFFCIASTFASASASCKFTTCVSTRFKRWILRLCKLIFGFLDCCCVHLFEVQCVWVVNYRAGENNLYYRYVYLYLIGSIIRSALCTLPPYSWPSSMLWHLACLTSWSAFLVGLACLSPRNPLFCRGLHFYHLDY